MKFGAINENETDLGDERKPTQTVIKVIGVGGGGSNAVSRMMEAGLSGVEFIVANTDIQALNRSNAPQKLSIGTRLTGGLGAGGKPQVGESAANEDKEKVANALRGANMVFVTAGMGGGTGTGAAPIIAQVAREMGALTVGVVTKPFEFEGKVKMQLANEGIAKLRESVDTLIVIPNQTLFKVVDKKTNIRESFRIADDILRQSVQGISDVITKPGDINIDFADVKTTMENKGEALMGMGVGKGESRAVDAATAAIRNPLLEDLCVDGARNVLVNVTGGESLTLYEFQEVVSSITAQASPESLVISGMVYDPELTDEIQVTVIATGFQPETIRIKENKAEQKTFEGDFMQWEEWRNITERAPVRGLSARNGAFPEELDIPTVIREKSRNSLNDKN
jgi:cell division protein FtsZ